MHFHRSGAELVVPSDAATGQSGRPPLIRTGRHSLSQESRPKPASSRCRPITPITFSSPCAAPTVPPGG